MDVTISGNGLNVNPMMRNIVESHIESDLHNTKGLTNLNATFSREARAVKLELVLTGKGINLDAHSTGMNSYDIIGSAFAKLASQLETAKGKKKSKGKKAKVSVDVDVEELEEATEAIAMTAETIFEAFIEEEAAAEEASVKEVECPVVVEVNSADSDSFDSSDSSDD